MNKRDVVFLVPYVTYAMSSSNNIPCLGICYIKSFLNTKNYSSIIIDNYQEMLTDDELFSRISKYSFDILGVYIPSRSTLYSFIAWYLKYNSKLRKHKIVLGGTFASLANVQILNKFKFVDFIVHCFGEQSLLDILEYHKGLISIDEINSVSYIENGVIHSTNNSDCNYKLETIPLPDIDYYINGNRNMKYTISTSRGCIGKCSFCLINKYYGKNIFYHSVKFVINNINMLYSYGIKNFTFIDDNFFTNKNITQDIYSFTKLLPRDISFSLSTRIKDIVKNKNEIIELSRHGLNKIFIGIESFSDNTLRIFNKELDNSMITHALDFLESNNIKFSYGFIFFHPWNTMEELNNNIEQIENLAIKYKSVIQTTPIQDLEIHYGTGLYYKAKKEGLLFGDIFKGFKYTFMNKNILEIHQAWNRLNADIMANYDKINKKEFLLEQINGLKKIIKAHNILYK